MDIMPGELFPIPNLHAWIWKTYDSFRYWDAAKLTRAKEQPSPLKAAICLFPHLLTFVILSKLKQSTCKTYAASKIILRTPKEKLKSALSRISCSHATGHCFHTRSWRKNYISTNPSHSAQKQTWITDRNGHSSIQKVSKTLHSCLFALHPI